MRCLSTSGAKPRDISTVTRFQIEYNTSSFTNYYRWSGHLTMHLLRVLTHQPPQKEETSYLYIQYGFKEIWRWNKLHTFKLTKMCWITFDYKIIQGRNEGLSIERWRKIYHGVSLAEEEELIYKPTLSERNHLPESD